MRQLIERLGARVNQLEAEKSAAMVKPATPATETPVAAAPSSSPDTKQTGAVPDGDRKILDDRPFFLTSAPGVLKKDQNTATLGLVWWFGKEGGW